ncbi:MAG: histidine kinase dimerization/phospho-acceptor domain-containing protein, partial [Kofleriaceae bacterium]
MAWLELDRLDVDAALAPAVAALIADAPSDATLEHLELLRARVYDHLEARDLALAPADARRLTSWFVDQRSRNAAPHRLELERFRIAIRSSTISLYEAMPDGTMTWIYNSQLERRAGSMIGRRLAELMSPADASMFEAILAESVASGRPRAHEAIVEIGGVKRIIFLAFEPRRDPDGNVIGLVGSSVDITDPKRAEEELARALAYRETMMGILGHDLRNPVGAIQGVVGLLQLDPALSAPAKKGLAHIDKAARRMGEMIQTVLDFTRARHGGFPIKRHAMSLEELCTSVIDEG